MSDTEGRGRLIIQGVIFTFIIVFGGMGFSPEIANTSWYGMFADFIIPAVLIADVVVIFLGNMVQQMGSGRSN